MFHFVQTDRYLVFLQKRTAMFGGSTEKVRQVRYQGKEKTGRSQHLQSSFQGFCQQQCEARLVNSLSRKLKAANCRRSNSWDEGRWRQRRLGFSIPKKFVWFFPSRLFLSPFASKKTFPWVGSSQTCAPPILLFQQVWRSKSTFSPRRKKLSLEIVLPLLNGAIERPEKQLIGQLLDTPAALFFLARKWQIW